MEMSGFKIRRAVSGLPQAASSKRSPTAPRLIFQPVSGGSSLHREGTDTAQSTLHLSSERCQCCQTVQKCQGLEPDIFNLQQSVGNR